MWQDGLLRWLGEAQRTEDGFPARRDVRFAAVLASILMLITSYIVRCVFRLRRIFDIHYSVRCILYIKNCWASSEF